MSYLVSMKNISKSFGTMQALKNVDFRVSKKELIGLVGDNGAGKTTLIKILSGALKMDDGKIYIQGRDVKINSPKTARDNGIEVIHQNFALVEDLSVAKNVILGREPVKKIGPIKFVDLNSVRKKARSALKEFGLEHLNVDEKVRNLSGGERQCVSIARAMYFKAELIILDEPTNHLSVREAENFRKYVKHLNEKGVSAIYISHNIHELYPLVDRLVVLDNGRKVADLPKKKTSEDEIVNMLRKGGGSRR